MSIYSFFLEDNWTISGDRFVVMKKIPILMRTVRITTRCLLKEWMSKTI
jgi:hypothetical protein